MKWRRTVNSVLTVCLTKRDNRRKDWVAREDFLPCVELSDAYRLVPGICIAKGEPDTDLWGLGQVFGLGRISRYRRPGRNLLFGSVQHWLGNIKRAHVMAATNELFPLPFAPSMQALAPPNSYSKVDPPG